MKTNLYPLLFEPVYKDYIWGGHRIPEIYNRDVDQEICAESWEISDRPEGMSVVTNGEYAGKSLDDLCSELKTDIIGTNWNGEGFPLLIKLIDARQRLSVQVHPDDDSAVLYGGEAKTEMWYVLAGDEGAKVFAGLREGVTAESFRQAIEEENLEEMLCSSPAVEGQAIYIQGGRVHAIAEGCLLLEVQQNSNTTYRVYDWGRLGHDGKPRELHVKQAFEVIDWDDTAPDPVSPVLLDAEGENRHWDVVKSEYFHMRRIDLSEVEQISNDGKSFHALFVIAGSVTVKGGDVHVNAAAGTSCLLPAGLPEYSIVPDGEAAVALITL